MHTSQMTTEQKRFNKEYILSLPFEDGLNHLFDIINKDFKYQKQNDDANQIIENFLNQECFRPYYRQMVVNSEQK